MIFREMRFIGKNGSMGYKTGKFYTLEIMTLGAWESFWRGYSIVIQAIVKVTRKGASIYRLPIPYKNIETFLANWK